MHWFKFSFNWGFGGGISATVMLVALLWAVQLARFEKIVISAKLLQSAQFLPVQAQPPRKPKIKRTS